MLWNNFTEPRQRNVVSVLAESLRAPGIGLVVWWCAEQVFSFHGTHWLAGWLAGAGWERLLLESSELEIRETANWLWLLAGGARYHHISHRHQPTPPPSPPSSSSCQLHLMTCSHPVSQSTIKQHKYWQEKNCKYLIERQRQQQQQQQRCNVWDQISPGLGRQA